jgi:hypothetical protein
MAQTRRNSSSSNSSNSRNRKNAGSRTTGTMSRSEAASVAGSAPHSCRGRQCSSK